MPIPSGDDSQKTPQNHRRAGIEDGLEELVDDLIRFAEDNRLPALHLLRELAAALRRRA